MLHSTRLVASITCAYFFAPTDFKDSLSLASYLPFAPTHNSATSLLRQNYSHWLTFVSYDPRDCQASTTPHALYGPQRNLPKMNKVSARFLSIFGCYHHLCVVVLSLTCARDACGYYSSQLRLWIVARSSRLLEYSLGRPPDIS